MVCGRKGDEVGEADEDENEGWEESRRKGPPGDIPVHSFEIPIESACTMGTCLFPTLSVLGACWDPALLLVVGCAHLCMPLTNTS